LNAVIQGSAADIFKMKLKAIYDEKKTLGIKALRQPVHDEFNGDKVPGEKYTKRMREFFNEQVIKLRIPIIWNLKTGKNWRECH
jgi:DNA polymerase I-like protein with 3'-5' exonuclease and polymerase domains